MAGHAFKLFVAVLPGALVAGETISSAQILALMIILSGVLLVNIPKYKIKPQQWLNWSGFKKGDYFDKLFWAESILKL